MSALLTRLLALSVRPQVVPSKVSQMSQPSEGLLVLSLYGQDRETRHLAFSLRLGQSMFFLAASRPPSQPKPSNFLMSLRKHLDYARLSAVEQNPGERVVSFQFETSQGTHRLVYEGLAKYPNLILVGPGGTILSAVRYLNDVERPVLPQSPYAPPPQPKDKPNLWALDGSALGTLAQAVPSAERFLWLKTSFRGMDAETSHHLADAPEGPGKAWDRLRAKIDDGTWGKLAVVPGPPPVLHLYAPPDPQPPTRLFQDPLKAASYFQENLEAHSGFAVVRKRFEQELRSALKREKKILDKLKGDRAEAEKADQYQWWGEILMAHLHNLPAHSAEVELEDLVRGTGGTVRVKLNPEFSPLLNAQKFFKKALKGSRGLVLVAEREQQVRARWEELKSAERSLPAFRNAEEVQKAWSFLFGKKPVEKALPKKKEEKIPTPNVVRRKLSKDWELVAGTSGLANEYVTFQLAQAEDLWFHVRDFPGSHVLLRRLRREALPVDSDLLEAAREAAQRSKAPAGTKITVSYTLRKYVKKIPGMGAGTVSFTKEQSLVVEKPATTDPVR